MNSGYIHKIPGENQERAVKCGAIAVVTSVIKECIDYAEVFNAGCIALIGIGFKNGK